MVFEIGLAARVGSSLGRDGLDGVDVRGALPLATEEAHLAADVPDRSEDVGDVVVDVVAGHLDLCSFPSRGLLCHLKDDSLLLKLTPTFPGADTDGVRRSIRTQEVNVGGSLDLRAPSPTSSSTMRDGPSNETLGERGELSQIQPSPLILEGESSSKSLVVFGGDKGKAPC